MVSFSFENCWFFKLNPTTFDFHTRDHWATRKSPRSSSCSHLQCDHLLRAREEKRSNHTTMWYISWIWHREKGKLPRNSGETTNPCKTFVHTLLLWQCATSLNQMSATIKLLKYPKILEGAVVRHFAVNYIILGSKSHPEASFRKSASPKIQQKTLHPYTTFKHSASANSICLG